MYVIGTAGHVDHGKSTLVQALTGINPDRLKEEQERQMTIDLGFAWLTLPSGKEVGIVDVPGHRDFIENMLAGVGGIDAVLFVIAADEGIMPQTKEHLAILDLLNISRGLVALTKCDLIDDPEWLQLVKNEIGELFSSTALAEAKIVQVSATNGTGLDALLETLDNVLTETALKKDIGKPRLPIDRVFSIKGFGTVVTGTLLDGTLTVGEEVVVMPNEIRGRVRGLQSHKHAEETASPGSRTAVNISGVDVSQIQRGNVVIKPGAYQTTKRIDAQIRVLPDAGLRITHNDWVKCYQGADEFTARVRLIGERAIDAGGSGFVQLDLDHQGIMTRGDNFILRRPSPAATIGGGVILDAHPQHKHKRFHSAVIARFEKMSTGDEETIILDIIDTVGPINDKEVLERSGLPHPTFQEGVRSLLHKKAILSLNKDLKKGQDIQNTLLVSADAVTRARSKIMQILSSFHQKYPLRMGMKLSEVINKSDVQKQMVERIIDDLLIEEVFKNTNGYLSLQNHQAALTEKQSKMIDALFQKFEQQSYMPPSKSECIQMVGPDVFRLLVDQGKVIEFGGDVVFRSDEFENMKEFLLSHLHANGEITLAAMRDEFKTSRKFALAFLERMDTDQITERQGDVRILKH